MNISRKYWLRTQEILEKNNTEKKSQNKNKQKITNEIITTTKNSNNKEWKIQFYSMEKSICENKWTITIKPLFFLELYNHEVRFCFLNTITSMILFDIYLAGN